MYLSKTSTSNCQVKFDSVKKRQNYKFFNMTAYRFFSIQKMFWLQHQFNNIDEQHS